MTSEEPAASLKVGDDGFFKAIVETSVDPFVVVDADLILRYASPSIELLLGWPPSDWIGKSIAELLDPESLDVALQGIGELVLAPTEDSWVGAPVRIHLLTEWNDIIPVDVMARETARTGVDGYVVQIHRAAATQALNDAVDTILEGEDLDQALTQLTKLIEHDITRTSAVLGSGWDGERFEHTAGKCAILDLDNLNSENRNAIRYAMRSGRKVIDIFNRLASQTRAAATQIDMHSCWCAPVIGDDFDAALFIWHTEPGPPGVIYQVDIQRSVNLTRLALQWSSQQRRLAYEVSHDQLTGLTNRAEFQNQLDATTGRPRAVLFCDLDDFKPVNERFGHRVGDAVLSAVAGRMNGVCHDCTVARLGGDEFAVLLNNAESLNEALDIASLVTNALASPIVVDGHSAQVGVTIGVAFDPTGTAPSDVLMDEADRLLLSGKSKGKNQVLSITLDG